MKQVLPLCSIMHCVYVTFYAPLFCEVIKVTGNEWQVAYLTVF